MDTFASVPQPRSPADFPWVQYTRYTLIFTGIAYVVLGMAIGPLFFFMSQLEKNSEEFPPGLAILLGVISFFFCAAFGAVNFVASYGLRTGRKWGWIMSVIIGGLYAPSGCMLFGVLILYGMLNDPVRRFYMDGGSGQPGAYMPSQQGM